MSEDLYIVAQSLDNSNADDIWENGEYKKSDGQSKNHEEKKRIIGEIFTETQSNIGSYKSGVKWITTPNILYIEILSENPDNCGRLSPIYIEAKTADKNVLIESLNEFSKKSNRGVFHAAKIKDLEQAVDDFNERIEKTNKDRRKNHNIIIAAALTAGLAVLTLYLAAKESHNAHGSGAICLLIVMLSVYIIYQSR